MPTTTTAENPGPGIASPRLVLRLGFTGSQYIKSDDAVLTATIEQVYALVARVLGEIVPNVRELQGSKNVSTVSKFYTKDKALVPLIRLITGLCQGGDALANTALRAFRPDPAPGREEPYIAIESAGVIPFDVAGYYASRKTPEFQDEFVRHAQVCSYILTLDATYNDSVEESEKRKRNRAYRAQSTLLLRQCDILIAMGDPTSSKGSVTFQTIRDALAFNLPVVFINAGRVDDPRENSSRPPLKPEDDSLKGHITLIEPGDDFSEVFERIAQKPESSWTPRYWRGKLRFWVEHLTADPDIDRIRAGKVEEYGPDLLTEFFAESQPEPRILKNLKRRPPPRIRKFLLKIGGWLAQFPHVPETLRSLVVDMQFYNKRDSWLFSGVPLINAERLKNKEHRTWGESIWEWLYKRSSPVIVEGNTHEKYWRSMPRKKDLTKSIIDPYEPWRNRASNLNSYYNLKYRGGFIFNYFLAPIAVLAATFSLVFLRYEDESIWWFGLLMGLAAIKLCILVAIYLNTTMVNGRNWNDRAVDYRYLSERLRAMSYLPLVGSVQPPVAAPWREATEALRQSAMDWLFNAVIRSVSPVDMVCKMGREKTLNTHELVKTESHVFGSQIVNLTIYRVIEPSKALETVSEGWIEAQAEYHRRTASIYECIHECTETWMETLNIVIIVMVCFDIALAFFSLKYPSEYSFGISTVLIMFAAFIPAAVASVNAIRVQSESRRLALRSSLMFSQLWGSSPDETAHATPRVRKWWPKLRYKLKSVWQREVIDRNRKLHAMPETLELPKRGPVRKRSHRSAARRLARKLKNAKMSTHADPQSWTPEVLHVTESVAKVFTQEVAEWSALYAKELPES